MVGPPKHQLMHLNDAILADLGHVLDFGTHVNGGAHGWPTGSLHTPPDGVGFVPTCGVTFA